MKLSEELQARGFVYQFSTDDLGEILDGEKRTVYLGIDPTATSIHVGNLVPFMLLNHLLKAGHKVYLLIGGGTALIGDPGGRDTERPLAEIETISAQAKEMEVGIKKLTTGDITFVNNYDWLTKLSLFEYLRNVGKHFTVNAMIKKDAVSARMQSEQGISYTEFSYALLQSYDYYHLHTTYGCDLQIGGSDQWGNLISGVDYIRKVTGHTVFALTMALVVDKTTGKKFGKSIGNAVWLDAEKTSPYELYQFWLNTDDASVIDYLKLFTFLSLTEIADIEQKHQLAPETRLAQNILAKEVVAFVHGADSAESVVRVTEALFGTVPLKDLQMSELELLKKNAPTKTMSFGVGIVDALVEAELATSKREARTFVESGAVAVNDEVITDVSYVFSKDVVGQTILLKRGKKLRVVVELHL